MTESVLEKYWYRGRAGFNLEEYCINDFGNRKWLYWIHHKNLRLGGHLFAGLIVAEADLRGLVQRHERLQRQLKAQEKLPPGDKSRSHSLVNELESIKRELMQQEYRFYEKEAQLPDRWKEMYDSVREDPKWYCRAELVQDCIARGGCCSRDCGCCASRHATTKRQSGVGHCTIECGCCCEYRGFDLTPEQKKKINTRLQAILLHRPFSCLLKMAVANFMKPQPQHSLSQKIKNSFLRRQN